eukprot:2991802-Pyramimonas_sp.AAC.1
MKALNVCLSMLKPDAAPLGPEQEEATAAFQSIKSGRMMLSACVKEWPRGRDLLDTAEALLQSLIEGHKLARRA